jgi:hypothetical protein
VRGDPQYLSFNGGELSPLLRGRTDLSKYLSGGEFVYNFLPTPQGPLRRRLGTQFIGELKAGNSIAVLIPFEANTGASFVLEVGNGYTRFWSGLTRGPIFDVAGSWSLSGSTPAELATPWTGSELFNADSTIALQWVQSNDVMWVVHPRFPPVKIMRDGIGGPYHFAWAYWGDGVNVPTPFDDIDPTTAITVSASADSGLGITLTASAALFATTDINRYFYIEQPAADSILPWEVNKVVTTPTGRRSDGRNYDLVANATTGTQRPVHSSGAKFDGGAQWTWHDDGYGIVAIRTFISTTSVTADVVKAIPRTAVGAGNTTRWARAAWNEIAGFPSSIAFFRERLCFARAQTVWCSVAGDFENFQSVDGGEITPDLALTFTIAAEKNDRILWLSAQNALIAGTASGEYAISEMSLSDPFGPGNVKAPRTSGYGARAAIPLKVSDGLLYIQRGGLKVREVYYDFQTDGYPSADRTLLADHIAPALGFAKWAYSRGPDNAVWIVSATGELFTMTYDASYVGSAREQAVYAWARHRLGGFGQHSNGGPIIQGITAITSPNQTDDDVWLLVRRFSGSEVKSYIEIIGPSVDIQGTGAYYGHDIPDVTNSNYLDCSVMTTVAPGATFIPAAHIPVGQGARALVEGYVIPSGAMTASGLPVEPENISRRARIGFDFQSDFKPMPLVGQSGFGSPMGKLANVHEWVVRLYKSVSFGYGPDEADETFLHEEFRTQDMDMDEAVPLFTGDKRVQPQGGHRDVPLFYIRQDQPLPLTVIAIYPKLTVEDR